MMSTDRAPRAVITGATKGIGRAIARALITEGYDLAVCARNSDDLDAMRDILGDKFPRRTVITRPTDVSNKSQLRAFADTVLAEWDEIDVLVNNAGLFTPGDVLTEADGTVEMMVNVNVFSAYYLTRYLHDALVQGPQAHVFNMCSVASLLAYPGGGSYTIAKFALRGFSMVLRKELKTKNVKVTTILAGATWSDSWAGADFPESRLMQASDIAEAVLSSLRMSPAACVAEILIRPQLGDL